MKNQETGDIEALFGRLLDRQMFPWENKQRAIGEAIITRSKLQAKETLAQLNQGVGLRASEVIERIEGRAESWNYGEFLDHLRLLEIPHLRIF